MPDTYQAHVGAPSVNPVLQAGLIDWSRAIEGGAQIGEQFAARQQSAVESAVRTSTEIATLPGKLRLLQAQADNLEKETAILPQKLQLMAAEARLSGARADQLQHENEMQAVVDGALTTEEHQQRARTLNQLNMANAKAQSDRTVADAQLEVARAQNYTAHTAALGSALQELNSRFESGTIDVLDADKQTAALTKQFWAADPELVAKAGQYLDKVKNLPDMLAVTGDDGKPAQVPTTKLGKAQFLQASKTFDALYPAKAGTFTYQQFLSGQTTAGLMQQHASEIAALVAQGYTPDEADARRSAAQALAKAQDKAALVNAQAASAVQSMMTNLGKVTMPDANGNQVSILGNKPMSYLDQLKTGWKVIEAQINNHNGGDVCTLKLDGVDTKNMTWNQAAQVWGPQLLASCQQAVDTRSAQRAADYGGLTPLVIPELASPLKNQQGFFQRHREQNYSDEQVSYGGARALIGVAKQAVPALTARMKALPEGSPEALKLQRAINISQFITSEFPSWYQDLGSEQESWAKLQSKFDLTPAEVTDLKQAGDAVFRANEFGLKTADPATLQNMKRDFNLKFYGGIGALLSPTDDLTLLNRVNQTLSGIPSIAPVVGTMSAVPGAPPAAGAAKPGQSPAAAAALGLPPK